MAAGSTPLRHYTPQELRERLKSAVGGNDWRFEPGSEPGPLAALMSPLRFDISIRVDYFRFLRRNREVFDEDMSEYVERARMHPYYTWFTQVSVPVFRPELVGDPPRLEEAFRDRLVRTAVLADSFELA